MTCPVIAESDSISRLVVGIWVWVHEHIFNNGEWRVRSEVGGSNFNMLIIYIKSVL